MPAGDWSGPKFGFGGWLEWSKHEMAEGKDSDLIAALDKLYGPPVPGLPPPTWEVRHREWLSLPSGEVEVWELRQDHNVASHFGIFSARGMEGGTVEWLQKWDGTVTLSEGLKTLGRFIAITQDEQLCEVGLPFWRCKCGEGFYAPKGARADKYHDCAPRETCHNLGAEGHFRCPQQEEPPEVAPSGAEPAKALLCRRHGRPPIWREEQKNFVCSLTERSPCCCADPVKHRTDLMCDWNLGL